jgi:hypothetical protein
MVDSPLNEAHKNGLCDIKIKLHNKNTLASKCGSKIALRYSHHGNLRFSVRPDDERNLAHVLCMGAGVFEKGKKEKEKEGVFV